MSRKLEKLKALADRLPKHLRSDWHGTNHYELSSSDEDYWWLMVGEGIHGIEGNPCESEHGRRLGLIMDIAEEVCRLKDMGAL